MRGIDSAKTCLTTIATAVALWTAQSVQAQQPKAIGDWTLVRTLTHKTGLMSMAFSPDGRRLLVGSDGREHRIFVYNAATWKEERSLVHPEEIYCIVFSPNGRRLATSCFFPICLWNTKNWKLERKIKGLAEATQVAFVNDSTIVSSSMAQEVAVIDANSGKIVRILKGHTGPSVNVAVSPDRSLVATAGWDNTVRLWSARTWKPLRVLKAGGSGNKQFARFSPDGRLLAAGYNKGDVGLWDVRTGKLLKLLKGHAEPVCTASFTKDSRQIATGGWDGSVRFWDVRSARCLQALTGNRGRVESVTFSPDEKLLLAAGEDGLVRMWRVNRNQQSASASQVVPSAANSEAGELAKLVDMMKGILIDPRKPTPSDRAAFWSVMDRHGGMTQDEIDKLKDNLSYKTTVYNRYFFEDALAAYRTEKPVMSTERREAAAKLLAGGMATAAEIKRANAWLSDIAEHKPFIYSDPFMPEAAGTRIPLSESFLLQVLNSLDRSAERVTALFVRPTPEELANPKAPMPLLPKSAKWTAVEPRDAGFAVEFPGRVVQTSEFLGSDNPVTLHTVDFTNGAVEMAVSYCTYPSNGAPRPLKTIANDVSDVLARLVDGRETSRQAFQLQGVDALEVRLRGSGGKAAVARVYVKGKSCFQTTVVTTPGYESSPETGRFLDSFILR